MNRKKDQFAIRGYVIAGGRSRRMGFDKRRFEIGGRTLLSRTASVIEGVLGEPPLLVGDNPVPDAAPGYRWLPDALPNCGPLGGIVSALRDAERQLSTSASQACPANYCGALVLATDLPRIDPDDVRVLIEEWMSLRQMRAAPARSPHAVCLGSVSRAEPLAAVYNLSTRPFWERRLANGQLSLRDALDLLNLDVVPPPGGSAALLNANTAEDLPW